MKFVAVTALAVKFPLASLATIVEAPLAEAAVVAELGMLVNEAPEPLNVVAVITFAVKEPVALRETIVDAPLASEAVVLALAIVPLDMLDALIAVKPPPAPLTVVNVPTLAAKDPLASRATMVLAPLASEAVVLALAIVPDVILLALIAVKDTPLPDKLVNVPVVAVTTLPANEPLASLATIVLAPLAELALEVTVNVLLPD